MNNYPTLITQITSKRVGSVSPSTDSPMNATGAGMVFVEMHISADPQWTGLLTNVGHYLVWVYLSYDRETCTTDQPFGRVV